MVNRFQRTGHIGLDYNAKFFDLIIVQILIEIFFGFYRASTIGSSQSASIFYLGNSFFVRHLNDIVYFRSTVDTHNHYRFGRSGGIYLFAGEIFHSLDTPEIFTNHNILTDFERPGLDKNSGNRSDFGIQMRFQNHPQTVVLATGLEFQNFRNQQNTIQKLFDADIFLGANLIGDHFSAPFLNYDVQLG